jgi:hypothetical protein
MQNPQPARKKVVLKPMNLRHSESVKNFVLDRAENTNVGPCTLTRHIFNAGLEAMYGIQLKNNEIIAPPPPL